MPIFLFSDSFLAQPSVVILQIEIREIECVDISTAKAGLREVSDIWLEGIRDAGNHVTLHRTRTIKITQHKVSILEC